VKGDAVEKLWMANPALPDNSPVPVTRLAYDEVWRHRDWQLVDTPPEHSELADRPPAPEPEQPPADTGAEPDTSDAGPATSTGKGRKSS
jgi:hypothetical protein